MRTTKQHTKRHWEIEPIRPRKFIQHRLHACELIGQHSLQQIELARKMCVKRFLANAELLRQVVHGYTAKSVTEKVDPRRTDNSLPVWITLSASRRLLVSGVHIYG